MTIKEQLHQLIDRLPPTSFPVALAFLQDLEAGRDPLTRALEEAPEDDEPLTPEEEAAVEEAREALRRGDQGRPWEEVRRELFGA